MKYNVIHVCMMYTNEIILNTLEIYLKFPKVLKDKYKQNDSIDVGNRFYLRRIRDLTDTTFWSSVERRNVWTQKQVQ